jgi:energy-coupling factor transporter ATP-binding protein EcfA2
MFRIDTVGIKNYRSILDETFPLSNLTALVGKNDVGKSNFLDAVALLFEGSATSLGPEDFYDPNEPVEIVVALRGAMAYLPLCDERNRSRVQQSIAPNDVLTLRRIAPSPREFGRIEILDPVGGKFSTPTGIDAAIRPMLPEMIFIEALADVKEELKGTQKDALGKLVGQIVSSVTDEVEPDLRKAYDDADKKLNIQMDGSDARVADLRAIESEISSYLREMFPSDSVQLRVALPSVREILGKVDVSVGGDPYYRKGQGVQRALYLSMVRALAARVRRAEKLTRPFVILFEEPEAFLHPDGQLKMRTALGTIAEKAQVLIATHSPLMIDASFIERIIRIEKRVEAPRPKPVTRRHGPIDRTALTDLERQLLRLFALQRSSKFLFAKGVLLVEGEGDEHLLGAIALTVRDLDFEAAEIALVEVGGKESVPPSAAILRMLGLKVWSVVDLDFLWRGAGDVLQDDVDLSQLVQRAKAETKWEELDDDKDERRRRMTEICCGALADRRDAVCAKLRTLGIYVLRRGEMEQYVGLGRRSKGEYLKAAAQVRDGTRAVKDVSDFAPLFDDIQQWAAS